MTAATTISARNNRGTQTAGRTPEELRELVSHMGAELELAPAEHIIEWAVATFGERFCITSSMGDAVLADLASKVAPGIDVVFLDTGYHFAETIGTRDAVELTLPVRMLSIEPAQKQLTSQFAYYNSKVTFRRANLAALLNFYDELAKQSPYLNLESITLQTERSAPGVINASLQISSMQVAK